MTTLSKYCFVTATIVVSFVTGTQSKAFEGVKTVQEKALVLSVALSTYEADIVTQTINAQCTTKATGGDARRYNCKSKPTTLRAPRGYVIDKDATNVRKTNKAGSEHSCVSSYADEIEIVAGSGLKAPRAISIQAKARSPKKRWGGRGWAHCEAKVVMTRIRKY